MNSILQRKSCSFGLMLVFCVLGYSSYAQVRFGGEVNIADNATFFIKSGEVSFATGTTTTTRTPNDYGRIQVANDVSFSMTGTSATQHINGFLLAAKSGTFTAPVGDGSRFAPVVFTDKSTVDLATIAYWDLDPEEVGDVLDGTIDAISTVEHWQINSTGTAKLTFSWVAASGIATLTNNTLADLVIAGYDPITNKWVQIPAVTTGNETEGTITSDYHVDLADYTHYTFARKGFCQPVIADSGLTRTYESSGWVGGIAPTIADIAVINAEFTGSLSCYSLTLNADLILEGNDVLEIVRGVTITDNAKVKMASTASITQRDESATPPPIELTKETKEMFSKRYVYWGTPISDNFFADISNATAQGQSDNNAFDLKYKYVSGVTDNTGSWQPLTATEQGKGFITRVAPKAPFVEGVQGPKIDMTFTGEAGNGVIGVPVAALSAYPLHPRSHNLLANPYPSAIDAAAFLRYNSDKIDGVIYVWNSNGGTNTNGAFSQSDYSAWTLAGTNTTTFDTDPANFDFDGIIPSAQGFKVRVIDYTSNAEVTFNNCMRLTQSGGSMYRVDGSMVNYSQENPNRFKVLMTGDNGVSSPILVAFNAQYTTGYDTMYDAYALSAGTATFYSILENTSNRLAINALPAFEVTNEVPVGVRKTGTTTETFTFQLVQPEGIFANGQAVYLFDALTGAYHNFVDGAVSIALSETVTNNRFQLRFQGPLSNPDFQSAVNFVTWYQNETIEVKCSEVLTEVQIFDITGRLVLTQTVNEESTVAIPFAKPQGVYMVKGTTNEGVEMTQKLIINN
jgi:hypothetical protein